MGGVSSGLQVLQTKVGSLRQEEQARLGVEEGSKPSSEAVEGDSGGSGEPWWRSWTSWVSSLGSGSSS